MTNFTATITGRRNVAHLKAALAGAKHVTGLGLPTIEVLNLGTQDDTLVLSSTDRFRVWRHLVPAAIELDPDVTHANDQNVSIPAVTATGWAQALGTITTASHATLTVRDGHITLGHPHGDLATPAAPSEFTNLDQFLADALAAARTNEPPLGHTPSGFETKKAAAFTFPTGAGLGPIYVVPNGTKPALAYADNGGFLAVLASVRTPEGLPDFLRDQESSLVTDKQYRDQRAAALRRTA